MEAELERNHDSSHAASNQWDILLDLQEPEIKNSTFGPEEDIPREVIRTRELDDEDFNSSELVNSDLIESAANFVSRRLRESQYDSFPLAKWIDEDVNSALDLKELNTDKVYENEAGGTCVQMAQSLHDFYERQGIKSYYVPFQTKGQINQAGHQYNPFGHLACIAPFIENGEKKFLLLDQGLCISKPIVFSDQENSNVAKIGKKKFQTTYHSYDNLPYSLEIYEQDDRQKYVKSDEAQFNPKQIMLNPEAFSAEALRVLPGFRVTRYNENGEVESSASVDVRRNIIKLKYQDNSETRSSKINFADSYDEFRPQLQMTAAQLGLSEDELITKLEYGKLANTKMREYVLAPSARTELMDKDHLIGEQDRDDAKIINETITRLENGKLLYHEHTYDISINTPRSRNQKTQFTPFGEAIPTLRILDHDMFMMASSQFLDGAMSHDNLLWVKSRYQSLEATKSDLYAQIWFNATNDDFTNPVEFLHRQNSFLEDRTFEMFQEATIINSNIGDYRITVQNIEQSGSNETPYMLNFAVVGQNGEKNYLPGIRYAIDSSHDEATAYIYAIQQPKGQQLDENDKKLAKKFNRILYKLNSGISDIETQEYRDYLEKRNNNELTGNEPYPENISDITIGAVASLAMTVKLLHQADIHQIQVPYFCPLRFQALARKGTYEQYRIQDNVSNKFLRTFRRLAYHVDGLENSQIDKVGYTTFTMNDDIFSKNPTMQKILDLN